MVGHTTESYRLLCAFYTVFNVCPCSRVVIRRCHADRLLEGGREKSAHAQYIERQHGEKEHQNKQDSRQRLTKNKAFSKRSRVSSFPNGYRQATNENSLRRRVFRILTPRSNDGRTQCGDAVRSASALRAIRRKCFSRAWFSSEVSCARAMAA